MNGHDNPYAAPHVSAPLEVEVEDPVIVSAKRRLARPAAAIIVMASVHAVFDVIYLVGYVISVSQDPRFAAPMDQAFLVVCLLMVHILQSIGGAKLGHLESRRLAYVGAVLAVIPFLSPLYVLGIPFGIWALVLLRQPEIKLAFELAER